jgi:predicted aconitase with swiveling domain
MTKTFKGRSILAGSITGEALVTRHGFNTLASYQKAVIMRSKKAVCADQGNPDLFGKVMTGKILCLPQTIGSTTGGLAILTISRQGSGPAALLFSEHIDSLACAGVILTEVWEGKRIIVVDQLGAEFLDSVKDGSQVTIHDDGTVEIL